MKMANRILLMVFFLLNGWAYQVFAANYYIDPDHPDASNANTGTSADAPWADWEGKFYTGRTTISAGDIIYIAGGTHLMGMRIHENTVFSGESNNSVILRPYAGHLGDTDVVIDNASGNGDEYSYRGYWTLGRSFEANDVVISAGVRNQVYICSESHTATSDNEPGVGGSYETYWQGGTPGLWSNSGTHDYVELDGNYNGGSFTFTDCSPWAIQLTGASHNGHQGWVLDGFAIDNTRSGIRLSTTIDTVITNFTISNLYSVSNAYDAVGIALRNACDAIRISDGTIYNINDTRGGDGDADGIGSTVVNGTYGVHNIVIQRMHVYQCGEDGVDVRPDQSLLLDNIVSHHNAVCGIKTWETAYVKAYNLLTYGNGESGLKIDRTIGDFWHVTSVGNYFSGLNFRMYGADVNIFNSLFADNKMAAVDLGYQRTGETLQVDFSHCLFYQSENDAVNTYGAAPDFSNSDVADGTLDAQLAATFYCLGCADSYQGIYSGSATNMMGVAPDVAKYPAIGKYIRSVGAATTTSLTLESGYESYPSGDDAATVGDFIETHARYGWDGINRELTDVSGADSEILTFANHPFSTTPSIGGWLVNWGLSPPSDKTYDLSASSASSNIVDGGIYDAGIHPAYHTQYGSAPDIGYFEHLDAGSDTSNDSGGQSSSGSGCFIRMANKQ